MTRGVPIAVYTQAKVQRFSARKAGELETSLKTMDAVTTLDNVDDPEELQLKDNGETKTGEFRYTRAAFNQVAQLIAPGLSKLMPDISGTVTLPDDRERLVDGAAAVNFWNDLVAARFPLFTGQRLIRNTQERTIEGIVGHKHQYLGNWDLYREVIQTLASYPEHRDVNMYAASLVGRRFSVWFRNDTPMFTKTVDGEPWPFYHGYYFTNGEATGTSVRGTLAVFTRKGTCLGSYKRFGRRVTHTGKDFQSRMAQMVTGLVESEVPVDELAEGGEVLLTRSLGYDATWDDSQRKEQTKKLVHSLSLLGVPKNLAVEIVEAGLTTGRQQGEQHPITHDVGRLYATRTLLDLFVPLLWLARKLDLSRREKVEQAAYELLAGRFLL